MTTVRPWTPGRRMAVAATAAGLAALLLARPGPAATTSSCPSGAIAVAMGQTRRLVAAQPLHRLREQPTQGVERVLVSFQRVGSHPGSFF